MSKLIQILSLATMEVGDLDLDVTIDAKNMSGHFETPRDQFEKIQKAQKNGGCESCEMRAECEKLGERTLKS